MFLQALLANTWNVLKKKDGIFGSIFYNMNANVLKFLFLMRLFLSRVNLIFCYRIKWALKWWLKYLSTNQIFFKLTHFWWFPNTVRGKLFDFSLKNTQIEVIFEGLVGDGMGFRSVPIIQSRELCDVAKNARHKLRDKSLCLALFLGLKKVCISWKKALFLLPLFSVPISNFQIALERNFKL